MSALAHFVRERDGRQVRFHLREEPDGTGLLMVDASAGVRLSPSGLAVARALLEQRVDDDDIVGEIARRFRGADKGRVRADLRRVRELLDRLGEPTNRYPLSHLDERGETLDRRLLSAPLAADVVVGPDTRATLRALWEAGVPQVVLVPTTADTVSGLAPLVEHAEDLGLICGVRVRGTDLPGDMLEKLARAGLDHVDVYFAGGSHDELFGEGDRARAELLFARSRTLDLCPTAVLPVVARTVAEPANVCDDLSALRPGAVTAYAIVEPDAGDDGALSPSALPQAAAALEEHADRRKLVLVWAPPVERTRGSLAERVRAGPRAAGEGSIRVEADGRVLPPTGPRRAAGRLGVDPWPRIWAHEAFRGWREMLDDPPRCSTCPGLASCTSGCPRDAATWARDDEGSAP